MGIESAWIALCFATRGAKHARKPRMKTLHLTDDAARLIVALLRHHQASLSRHLRWRFFPQAQRVRRRDVRYAQQLGLVRDLLNQLKE
jgi:hypothetical protein